MQEIPYSSRSLDDLLPEVRQLALNLCVECHREGIQLLIYCTYRNAAAQDELYQSGRTKKGRILTNARAGESDHQRKIAFDAVPVIGGKPQWDDEQLYARVGAIAERVGLSWAGRWRGDMRETAHFSYKLP